MLSIASVSVRPGPPPQPGTDLELQLPGRSNRAGRSDSPQIHVESLPGIGRTQLIVERRIDDRPGAAKIIVRPGLNNKLNCGCLTAVGIKREHVIRRVRIRDSGNCHQTELPRIIVAPSCCRHALPPAAVGIPPAHQQGIGLASRAAARISRHTQRTDIPAVKVLIKDYLRRRSNNHPTKRSRKQGQFELEVHQVDRANRGWFKDIWIFAQCLI